MPELCHARDSALRRSVAGSADELLTARGTDHSERRSVTAAADAAVRSFDFSLQVINPAPIIISATPIQRVLDTGSFR